MRGIKKMAIVIATIVCMSVPTTAIYAEDLNSGTQIEENQQIAIKVPEGTEYATENQQEAVAFEATIPSGQTTASVPLDVPYMGQLQLELSTESLTQTITIYIKNDKTGNIVSTTTLTPEQSSAVVLAPIEELGDYTVTVETVQTFVPITVNGKAVLYRDGPSRTLEENQAVLSYPKQKNQTVLYKFKVQKDGCILVGGRVYNGEKISIEILNSKKVSLNPKKSVLSKSNDYLMNYALKKGTYYIRVKNMNTPYRIRYRYYKHYDQAGKSKSKAVTLKKGKEKKGMLYLTDSSSKENWFKVTLSKKQKLSMIITSYGSEKLEYQILSADSNIKVRNSKFYPPNGRVRMKTGDTLPKGTYYIKISKPTTKNASGVYTIEIE